MKITYYLYNSFLIESGDKKIAIDPGGLMGYYFRFTSLIPKSEWTGITHIFVTHGDPDHFWHADRMARTSGAPIIGNRTMFQNREGKLMMLGPRDKGISYTKSIDRSYPLEVDETIEVDGIKITGIKTTHGPLTFKLGPFSKTLVPGPQERIGWGAIGFKIQFGDKTLVNLGDTILHKEEWKSIKEPDILMIPIGGREVDVTMDEKEALEAVEIMKPKLVIPCHYDCPALFTKNFNPADELWFKQEVKALGYGCVTIKKGESVEIREEAVVL